MFTGFLYVSFLNISGPVVCCVMCVGGCVVMQSIYCVIVKCFIVNSLLQVRLSTIKQLKCLKN